MNLKNFHDIAFLAAITVFLAGCAAARGINTNYEKRVEMTDLFSTADEAVEKAKKLEISVTRCPEGLKELGFDPDAQNVMRLPGAKGVRYILGTDSPQMNVSKPEDVQKMADEWNRYYIVVYPIKNPKVDKQAVFLNRQTILTTGPDGEYFIVCRDKTILSHDFSGLKNVNKPGENKKFGGNVLEWFLGIIGNPLGMIK